MGSGYSFFQHWVELNPDYIKLDCYYAAGLAENSLKQRIIKYLTKLFDGYSIIILEGIETEEDLNIAKQLGISYARAICLGDRPHGRVFLYKIIILEITGKMDVGERKFFGNFHQHGQTHLPFSPFQLAEVITGYAQKLRQLVPC
jgi:EAL domain-containing protein (putative c-di-GMP-specific phosphodiesterase class I)